MTRKHGEDKRKNEKQGYDDTNSEDDRKIIEVVPTMQGRMKFLIILFAVIVVVIAALIVRKTINTREYAGYSVVSKVETSGANIADYVRFGTNVLKVTKDGASYIDNTGNTVWDCSYAMKMPHAVVCGDYAVVADLNGRDVYVFNKSGKISSQSMNYDISDVDVASQGVYVVVLTAEDGNYINAYDKDSNSIYDRKTTIEDSGYPLDISISEDGNKLFTSYISVDGTSVSNYIAAYNHDSVGQNENADRLMGVFTFDDTIFPLVDFVDNDTVVCFGGNKIVVYAMSEKPSEKAVIEVGDTEMLGVFANSRYVGYISENAKDSDSKYTINIYGMDGKLEASTGFNNSFKNVYATEDELVIVGDFDCSIYYFNGSRKFTTVFHKNLINIVPDGNKLEYIVIFENETEIIRLSKEAKKKTQIEEEGTTAAD